MIEVLELRTIGTILIMLVFIYTLYLVRSTRLSAHLAISWIGAEVLLLTLIISDKLLSFFGSILVEGTAVYSSLLLVVVWIVFLMLDSLCRISSLNLKLKEISQEMALLSERVARIDEKRRSGI